MAEYYTAYNDRYLQVHIQNLQWAESAPSPIVAETLAKCGSGRGSKILELGCGEGRDAVYLLKQGYDVLATDVSPEAIRYCREQFPDYGGTYQSAKTVLLYEIMFSKPYFPGKSSIPGEMGIFNKKTGSSSCKTAEYRRDSTFEWVRIRGICGKQTEGPKRTLCLFGPSDWIRTSGLLNPIQARYQTSPHPDIHLLSLTSRI